MFKFELHRDNGEPIGHAMLTPDDFGRYATLAWLGNGCVQLGKIGFDYELFPLHEIESDCEEPINDETYVWLGKHVSGAIFHHTQGV